MKTELKEISPTRKQIDIEIEPEAVRKVYDQISDRYAKGANVPGFRPGHAPRAVVQTRFKDQIRTELLRELLPDAFDCFSVLSSLSPRTSSCESGGIGRRARLRIWYRKVWGFESPLSHQKFFVLSSLYLVLCSWP